MIHRRQRHGIKIDHMGVLMEEQDDMSLLHVRMGKLQ